MEEKIITTIKRKKGLDYRIDKKGNIIESKYNWLKDKTTLVVIAIIILGGLYYLQMSQSATNAKNFDEYCTIYYFAREAYIEAHPNEEVTIEKVFAYYESTKNKFDYEFNLDVNG